MYCAPAERDAAVALLLSMGGPRCSKCRAAEGTDAIVASFFALSTVIAMDRETDRQTPLVAHP